MLTKSDLKQIDGLFGRNAKTTEKKTDKKFSAFDEKMDKRFSNFEKRIDVRFVSFEKRIDVRFVSFEKRIEKTIKDAFQDFYESIFAPYVNKNEKEHAEMIGEIRSLRKDTDEIKDYVKDHDSKIEALETVTSIGN